MGKEDTNLEHEEASQSLGLPPVKHRIVMLVEGKALGDKND